MSVEDFIIAVYCLVDDVMKERFHIEKVRARKLWYLTNRKVAF